MENNIFAAQSEAYMRLALEEAHQAALAMETPVGAVIVRDSKVIATGRNRREECQNALMHAEIEALNKACEALGRWRLSDCDLYVTLEPCPMCAGALINARIRRVIFGAYDAKNGSLGSVVDLSALPYTHKMTVDGGVLREECAAELSDFFKKLRKKTVLP